MSAYRDRYGTRINVGDVVLLAITINHHNSRLYPWTTRVCVRKGRELILDDCHGFCRLRHMAAREMVVLSGAHDPATLMRRTYADFRRDFPPPSVL